MFFNSDFQIRRKEIPEFSEVPDSEIKKEPMLFRASFEYAWKVGGPYTRMFLAAAKARGDEPWDKNSLIDTRYHMLLPGFYPCIPGWHHDYVPRGEDGQPNYDNPEYRSTHLMSLINGDVAPTNLARGFLNVSELKPGDVAYRVWHPEVQSAVAAKQLAVEQAGSGDFIWFDDRTWHEGVPAVKRGWRMFFRISRFSQNGKDFILPARNEIRTQTQVYLTDPFVGW